MAKKISFTYKNRKINIKAKKCNFFEKIFGLMFKKREKAKALLFEFKKPTEIGIHSFFVFFPFIAVWFDNNDKIIKLKRVKPFTLTLFSSKPFSKILEIPINQTYNKEIRLLVGD